MVLVAPGALAVVAKLSVRRGVHCSCPVDCGFILGCRGPLTPAAMAARSPAVLWSFVHAYDGDVLRGVEELGSSHE